MAGIRPSIADQLRAVTHVGTEVEPNRQPVQLPAASRAPREQSPHATASRQDDARTHSPRHAALPPVTTFVPPATTDPAERLSYCQSAILDADRRTELATERVAQQYLLWVGEPYRIVREEKLYLPAGYDTFDAWGRDLDGHGSSYMNRVITIGPVVRALAPITRRQLREQPLRPLVAVQRDHGDDAVRECWQTAARSGDLTGRGLLAAAIECGYKVALSSTGQATDAPPPPALEPAGVLHLAKLKRLAAADPAQALALCRTLQADLAHLERDLTRQTPQPAADDTTPQPTKGPTRGQ